MTEIKNSHRQTFTRESESKDKYVPETGNRSGRIRSRTGVTEIINNHRQTHVNVQGGKICRRMVMRELDYGKLGQRIRQVRKVKGWSQGTLAQKCNVSMSFIGHIERGTRIMSMDTFVAICEALGVRADELLWGVPEPTDSNLLDMWDQSRSKDADSYTMYTKIMKSVADIMSGA